MNKVEHQKEHFETIAEYYYDSRKDEKHLLYKYLLMNSFLKEMKKQYKDYSKVCVLEPMCGYGEGKKIVQKVICSNIDYEGFDYSDILVEKIKRNHNTLNVYVQDITTWEPKKKYDIVILIGGLHHIYDQSGKVVVEISKALKKGGIFINFEPTNNNFLVKIIRNVIYKKNSLFDENTEKAFSLHELNNMYSKAGLKIHRQYYPGLLGYVLWYNPDAFPKLNLGNKNTVQKLFRFEKPFYANSVGKKLSFCTFTVLRKV